MKCVICDGGTARKFVEYKEFGTSFGRFKADVCRKCNEIYFDEGAAGKIQEKSKALGLFGLAKKAKVAEIGNSLAIRIPKEIAEFLALRKGGEVMIIPKSKKGLLVEI
ncbi:MAG TPA: AbrB/MazE/SpoVT family DNA-binding domain-containing protein [Candidatus Nanoarchaeia archaeon]|nr:AbrB/MazE/SpoVT family DNA-binding domain-containing protein [Candidatus Nanoarchaeia archaeon]